MQIRNVTLSPFLISAHEPLDESMRSLPDLAEPTGLCGMHGPFCCITRALPYLCAGHATNHGHGLTFCARPMYGLPIAGSNARCLHCGRLLRVPLESADFKLQIFQPHRLGWFFCASGFTKHADKGVVATMHAQRLGGAHATGPAALANPGL